jgi:hypothetical protein
MATTDMEDYWNDVEVAMEYAHLVAFDGCHKIYLAMDAEQAEWFRNNYNPESCETSLNFSSSAKEMLKKVREWYEGSCPLRFIDSVQTNHKNPNAGFVSLIPQGADEVYEDEDEDDEEMYV